MSRPIRSLSLVVPLWNEEHRLGATISHYLRLADTVSYPVEVIFSDDGSSDDTLAMLNEFVATSSSPTTVRVLSNPHLGKGAAVRNGVRIAANDVVAFCDLDLSVPLREVIRLAELAASKGTLVIGSRERPDSKIVFHQPHIREVLGRLFNRLAQRLVMPGVRDSQCGAKAADRSVWQSLLAASVEDGFAWDVELIALARANHVPVVEQGIEWSNVGGTRVRVGWDGVRMCLALFRIRRRVRKQRHH